MSGRGGRGGARGGARYNPNKVNIAGVELSWDLTGIKIDHTPGERFPAKPPPQAPPPNAGEVLTVQHYLAVRDRIHDGPFYTILADGMTSGKKRRHNDLGPTETSLFNPFTDNQTYTSKYIKVRRRIPKLDMRPYVTDFFPPELQPLLDGSHEGGPAKKRKTLQVAKTATAGSKIDSFMAQQGQRLRNIEEKGGEDADEDEDDDEEEEDDKPEAVEEDDNYSAVSSDSEESGDDYNAEQYFDNGDDDDGDDDGGYDNSYD